MSKREAVPKHSLPPQKQILSYMGRFINCPYAPDTERTGVFDLSGCGGRVPVELPDGVYKNQLGGDLTVTDGHVRTDGDPIVF